MGPERPKFEAGGRQWGWGSWGGNSEPLPPARGVWGTL